eukprot:Tbor_TRINITY_DN4558_c0_g2::TRINITY_DN4558_c0_g2_i1::g.15875::m.15875
MLSSSLSYCSWNSNLLRHHNRNPFSTYSMFLVIGVLFSCVLLPVTIIAQQHGKPENEIALLDAPTFTDETLPHGGIAHEPPLHGFRAKATDVTLTIVNKTFTNLEDGDWLVVNVYRPGAPKDPKAETTDWIGVFPADIPVSETLPIKYTMCSVDPNYKTTGKATIKLRLINTRTPLQIVFLTGCVIPKHYKHDTSIRHCHATKR